MKSTMRKLQRGFTLVELIVVMAIIAILAGAGVGTYFGVMNNARKNVAQQEATQLKTSIAAMFQTETTVTVNTETHLLTYTKDGLSITNVSAENDKKPEYYRDILAEAFEDDPANSALIQKAGDADKKFIKGFVTKAVSTSEYVITAFDYQGDYKEAIQVSLLAL